jgi:hypothetical protein
MTPDVDGARTTHAAMPMAPPMPCMLRFSIGSNKHLTHLVLGSQQGARASSSSPITRLPPNDSFA